jgi:nitrile hydratase subunit beta
MNGVHDMGGMHGMGPIEREPHEPVFHAWWEGRVFALVRSLRARGGAWNLDAFRHEIELLPAAEYLRMSYYERWLAWLIRKLETSGQATQSEISTGRPLPGAPRSIPYVSAATVATLVLTPGCARRTQGAGARFKAGQQVRARNMHPSGHTRLPRYVRGRIGTVMRDRGVFLFPDSRAHNLGEQPQHLYSVRFCARELFGEQASARDAVFLDMWDDYLDRA